MKGRSSSPLVSGTWTRAPLRWRGAGHRRFIRASRERSAPREGGGVRGSPRPWIARRQVDGPSSADLTQTAGPLPPCSLSWPSMTRRLRGGGHGRTFPFNEPKTRRSSPARGATDRYRPIVRRGFKGIIAEVGSAGSRRGEVSSRDRIAVTKRAGPAPPLTEVRQRHGPVLAANRLGIARGPRRDRAPRHQGKGGRVGCRPRPAGEPHVAPPQGGREVLPHLRRLSSAGRQRHDVK